MVCQQWYVNGNLHRIGGPAIIYETGRQEWYINGKRHREDGPARMFSDGRQEWWVNGNLHREDGLLLFTNDGTEWWINHVNITKKVEKWLQSQNIYWPWNTETQAQFLLTFS